MMAKKQQATGNKVYKVIQLVGTSNDGFEAAIESAVARAGETLTNLRWFEVKELRGAVGSDGALNYQAVVKISFEVK